MLRLAIHEWDRLCHASTSVMPVEPRTHAAVMVDGSAAHRARWAAGPDEPRRVGGERLHLGEAGLEVAGGRLGTLFDELYQRDFEALLVLAVGQRDESHSPERGDGFFQFHVRRSPRGGDRDPREDLLQPLRHRPKLILLQRQADQLAGGPQLQVEGPLSRFADRAGGDAADLLEVEAGRRHRCYSPAPFPPCEKKARRWGNGPPKRGRRSTHPNLYPVCSRVMGGAQPDLVALRVHIKQSYPDLRPIAPSFTALLSRLQGQRDLRAQLLL